MMKSLDCTVAPTTTHTSSVIEPTESMITASFHASQEERIEFATDPSSPISPPLKEVEHPIITPLPPVPSIHNLFTICFKPIFVQLQKYLKTKQVNRILYRSVQKNRVRKSWSRPPDWSASHLKSKYLRTWVVSYLTSGLPSPWYGIRSASGHSR